MPETVVFFTTQTSATASIWRILQRIDRSARSIRLLGHEIFLNGPEVDFSWREIPADGYLVEANCRFDLGDPHDLHVRNFMVNFRDPRDRICNEFMWNLVHPETRDEPRESIEARAAKLLEAGIDHWVTTHWRPGPLAGHDYYNLFLRNVVKIPEAHRTINTYARLCLDYDSFVERCCSTLGVALTPGLKAALEIERTDKLDQNAAWIGNRWNGSDVMPGRYKRELKPETIALLSEKYKPVLHVMAKLDPDYAHLYLENVDQSDIAFSVAPEPDPGRPPDAEVIPATNDGSFLCHTIVDRPDVRIDHFRSAGKTDNLVFTFTERTNRDIAGPGFATDFLLRNGLDVVAIKTNRDIWYENLLENDIADIERWLSWANPPYRLRLGYGSSMGAYAAIRCAGVLKLDRVVALSPLFDIKQDWDKRWHEDLAAMSPEIRMFEMPANASPDDAQISSQCDYLMIFDPIDPDIMHINRFEQLIPTDRLRLLPVPYSGHPAGQYLLELKMLGDVALCGLKEGSFPALAEARRRYKAESSIYLFQLAQHCLRRGHRAWALKINGRLIALKDGPEYQMQAARILESLGRTDEALAAVERTLAWSDYPFRANALRYQNDLLARRAAA